ncbi:hypothetical protein B6E66_19770 [Streptomyces maremycinicus]|nr:hypothetical protein B6E66_19770 [Streptomyces sp. B9173]
MGGPPVLPGPWDAAAARVFAEAGFPALATPSGHRRLPRALTVRTATPSRSRGGCPPTSSRPPPG